jgi:Dolichyl-phosphate-mannose-protein mannosyltransferase
MHSVTQPVIKTAPLNRPALASIGFAAILIVGIFLRLPPALFNPGSALHALEMLHPQPGFTGIGFDENLYRRYVTELSRTGLASYPDIAERYVAIQKRLDMAILPPTRFLYIWCASLWQGATGADSLNALKDVSSAFSIATLFLTAAFATRLRDSRIALCVCALMAFAPTQIHMSQHALIDGVFAFFALLCLWLLWENLLQPDQWRWLVPYSFALTLLVLTKENALFAYAGLLVALAGAWWFGYGKITRLLLAATLIGPLLGVAILINLCGSLSTTIQIYQLLVGKAAVLPYAIHTGDGPWYRYLVDLMLMSPVVLVLTLGGLFTAHRGNHPRIFLSLFMAGSFAIMCNVRYGMNLRYANMWDFSLRFLAVACLDALFATFKRGTLWLMAAVALMCALDFRQYQILFVRSGLYELVPEGLLRALQILK